MPGTGPGGPGRGATFADRRAFLASGAAWPDEPPPDCTETHASLVFLTRTRAWKLKKPVRLIHVDQRTLASRERLCREEIRVNREMSGDVYRGLIPLVQRGDGTLALGGAGRVVDWLIETVRLPAAEMLDRRLADGPAPCAARIEALSTALVDFYRRQAPSPGEGETFCRRLRTDSRVAAAHLHEMAGPAGIRLPAGVADNALPALRACRDEILERARRGVLREGHGDLRAEHVCLTEPPVLFDRLEIDHGLRLVDPFFEVNALGLECGLLGADRIRDRLLHRLAEAVPPPTRPLLSVYGIVSCLTRARFAVDHFRDDVVSEPAKYRARAVAYLGAAADLVARAQAH